MHQTEQNNLNPAEAMPTSVTPEAVRWLADFSSQQIAERTRAGMRAKAEAGGTISRAPIGYLNVVNTNNKTGRRSRTVKVDPRRGPMITWMFQRFAGRSNATIGEILVEVNDKGLTTRSTATSPARELTTGDLRRILANRYYRGQVAYDGEVFPGDHKPLIDDRTWHIVQERLVSVARASGGRDARDAKEAT